MTPVNLPRRAVRTPVVLATLAGLAASSGCSAFRAQFGGGIGLGADIKIPGLIHTGLDAGQYMNIGLRYDEPELSHDASATAIAWHWEGRESRRPGERRGPLGDHKLLGEHQCWGVLPPLTTENAKDGNSVWDFEIGVMLLVIDVRLGFNPLRWDNPDRRPAAPAPRQEPVTAQEPRPTTGEVPASAEIEGASPRPAPATREHSVYERDPLLPAVDPPAEKGD